MNNRQIKKYNKKQTNQITNDGFQNIAANLGINTSNQNLISQGTYTQNLITKNRIKLENAYRTSFIVGLVVDLFAEDMTKKGIDISSNELNPDEILKVESSFTRLNIWNKLCECIKWSRLYGGSLGYMLIDGQDPSTELDLNTISLNQFKGIYCFDRWQITPSMETITDFGDDYGLPMYYNLTSNMSNNAQTQRIHHSRCLRFTGVELPFYQAQIEQFWGESVIERIYDRLVAFDSTSTGAAQLVFKAHLRHVKIDGFRQILASGGAPLKAVYAMLDNLKLRQSNEGIAALDAKDEIDINQYSFGGLAEMVNVFLEQLSAACEIPMQRLLGQQSSGFGNGEDNLKNYASNIHRKQEDKLRRPLQKMLGVLLKSELDKEIPEDFYFKFNNLLEQNDKENAETNNIKINNVISAYEKRLISREEARKELMEIGSFTNFDAEISE